MACTSPVYANYLLQQHHRRRRQLECLKAFSGERRAQNGNGNGRVSMSGRGRRKERQKLEIRAGLPVVSSVPVVGPVLNFVINPTVLTAIYVFGGSSQMQHVHSTMSKSMSMVTCSSSTMVAMTGLSSTAAAWNSRQQHAEARRDGLMQGAKGKMQPAAIRFLSGFSQTTYSDTFATRFGLAAMWPVLFLASKKFRDNFKKAVTS